MGFFDRVLGRTPAAPAFDDDQLPPIELTCRCGAPMELILQYDAFDGAINLGDTGRAYVFACAQRCSPTAFAARWECC